MEQATAYQASGRDVVPCEVPVTTLSCILAEAGIDHINILKIDVEGFEEKVLNGNDWEKFRPNVVVVEATYPESPVRRPTKILSFMEQHGYRHVHFDGLNDFYLEREFPAPEGLTLPPNVFDRFVLREIADLRSQAESLRTNFTAAQEHAISLQTQVDEALGEIADLRSQAESLRTNFTAAQEHAISLQTRVDEALRTADALAVENRRIGHQTTHLTSENRRLRGAAEQMRAELLVLNRLLEPLHAIVEQMEQQRRQHEKELASVNNELAAANARLASAYSSLCWRLTAPLRWCDAIRRHIVTRLR